MAANRRELQKEIDGNLEAFQGHLGNLLDMHRGKYALLRHREVVGLYDTASDAQTAGRQLYGDELFSIQKVSDEPLKLGIFSHAVHLG
ncbi:MAG TPA: hypothetical protein VGM17_11640 [Rhizomicrobium sp.]|jgi:hypothetical protein